MSGAMVQSTTSPCLVSIETNIPSRHPSNTKTAFKMTCNFQTPPPMRVRSTLVNAMVNRSHDSSLTAATSALRVKASQIEPNDGIERFSVNATEVISYARDEARRLGHNFVSPVLILLGLIAGDKDTEIVAKVLSSMEIYLDDAHIEVKEILGSGSGFRSGEIPFTGRAKSLLEMSLNEAMRLEHLLLALLQVGGEVNDVLRNLGASKDDIRTKVLGLIGESVQVVSGDNKMSILEDYGTNLTELAEEKKLPPVVGREPLINRLVQILGRLRKNNPCLVGERGVGKRSIVEGLAQSIVDFDLPYCLKRKKVISVDMRLLLKRGFEDRVKKLMEEIKQSGEIILFIDDFDTLFGEGATRGVANI